MVEVLQVIKNKILKVKKGDVVVSIEVLEHIKYENGLNLINEIERVTKHKILITTPSYYFQTYTKKKLQKYLSHLSFFPISFFKKRNYIARGFRFSVLRNAFIDDKLNFIIPMFIPYFIPYLAKYVLYEKNIKRKP